MLQEIAEVQRFMLTYHDLAEKTTEGKYLAIHVLTLKCFVWKVFFFINQNGKN